MSLWGSHWFFGRVHFIPFTIHTFFSLQYLCFLHSWTLPKRDIFVDPPLQWRVILLFFSSDHPKIKLMGRPNGTMGTDRVGGVCELKGGKEKIRWDFFFFGKKNQREKGGRARNQRGSTLKGGGSGILLLITFTHLHSIIWIYMRSYMGIWWCLLGVFIYFYRI